MGACTEKAPQAMSLVIGTPTMLTSVSAVEAHLDSTPMLRGDFDGDGRQGIAMLFRHNLGFDDDRGHPACECRLEFEDEHLPSILVPDCCLNHLVNEGDLNQDGADELGLLILKPGDMKIYLLYSYCDGAWKKALDPIKISFKVWNLETDFVVPIPGKPGYVEVASHVHDDEGSGLSAYRKLLQVRR